MARTKGYQHYCVIARSLETIGEKWSLLLVRDLLRGPQRFTDLLRYMSGITPKWLTARLRELEQAGIVERESKPGKREVPKPSLNGTPVSSRGPRPSAMTAFNLKAPHRS